MGYLCREGERCAERPQFARPALLNPRPVTTPRWRRANAYALGMSSRPASCIYCNRHFDPHAGEGDHIIPAALGEFTGLRRFRGACSECNIRIGKSEAQLLRCGSEAYLARISQPAGRRSKKYKAWQPALGAPPPAMFSEHDGIDLLVRPVDGNPSNVETIDQLVIVDEQGGQHPIPIYPGMDSDAVRARIESLHIQGRYTVRFNVSDDHYEWLNGLLTELWPHSDRAELPPVEPGVSRKPGRVMLTVSDHYFRAVAKIALHFYLCYCARKVSGHEPEFAEIRKFILSGGRVEDFFSSSRDSPVYFGVPFGPTPDGGTLSPPQWCHLLAADDTQPLTVVYLQLFIGPGYVNRPHYVVLGRSAGSKGSPGAWAQLLTWRSEANAKGLAVRVPVMRGGRPSVIVGSSINADASIPIYTEYE